jgi:ketosteroid isomerase-like protein
MRAASLPCLVAAIALGGCAVSGVRSAAGPVPVTAAASRASAARADLDLLQREVRDTERAFARTMADRDLAAFQRFLAPDTIWFDGPGKVLRGPEAVVGTWGRYFAAPAAPFSWEPDEVEVLDSGLLASSSGPVRDPAGKLVGRFHSIWRREADGRWRIVFDRGEAPCRCAEGATADR